MAGRRRRHAAEKKRFCFGTVAYEQDFTRAELRDLIPGALNADRAPRRRLCWHHAVYLDTEAVFRRIVAAHNYLAGDSDFRDSIECFINCMGEHTDRRISRSENILVEFLERSYTASRDWNAVLKAFVTMHALLQRQHFNGSPNLRKGLDNWLRQEDARFMAEASLETALQFVDFAPENSSDELMRRLMRKISANDRQRMVDSEGHVNLRLGGTVSDRVIDYVRRYHPRPSAPVVQWHQQATQCPQPGMQWMNLDPPGHCRAQVQQPPWPGLGFGWGGVQQIGVHSGWPNHRQQAINLPGVQVQVDREGGRRQIILGAGGSIW